MKHQQAPLRQKFAVLFGNRRAQCAEMVLSAGACEGGPDNYHRGADQWLIVLAGSGLAIVNRRRIKLRRGTILLIERGDRHEIRNTGRKALQTVNVYVPPAFRKNGNPLPRGKK